MLIVQRRFFSVAVKSWNSILLPKVNNHFQVQVDGKVIQNTRKSNITFPNEHLAIMFAQEWATYGKNPSKIVNSPVCMISQRANILALDNNERQESLREILNYLPTDTILFWNESEQPLYNLQLTKWQPIIASINEHLQTNLMATTSLKTTITASDHDKFYSCINSICEWKLASFELCAKVTKSLLLPYSMLFQKRHNPDELLQLSRLEEEYQIQKWGTISNIHPIQKADLSRLLHLSNCVFQLASF